jgi:hypothetical protein
MSLRSRLRSSPWQGRILPGSCCLGSPELQSEVTVTKLRLETGGLARDDSDCLRVVAHIAKSAVVQLDEKAVSDAASEEAFLRGSGRGARLLSSTLSRCLSCCLSGLPTHRRGGWRTPESCCDQVCYRCVRIIPGHRQFICSPETESGSLARSSWSRTRSAASWRLMAVLAFKRASLDTAKATLGVVIAAASSKERVLSKYRVNRLFPRRQQLLPCYR